MRFVRAIPLAVGLLLVPASEQILGQARRSPDLSPAERSFIDRHWRRPIALQGASPARFSPIERSLEPASCGTCHPVQYADWKTTLHARTMGPGVAGQLAGMFTNDPESARACLECHAPLAEQSPEITQSKTRTRPNPAFDASLQAQGLVCAGCHVRGHQRFGPPRRDVSTADPPARGSLPHNGVTRASAFLRSEFCGSCHQFAPDGFALNGKLLENTLAEWRASPAARQGLQCQDCHMPDRRHLWRGIHDPEMVKSGVEISITTDRPRYRPGDQVRATLTVTSRRVGHYFPTYVTPRVIMRAELLDAKGQPVAGSHEERAIGREVLLDLSREVADTRIPPGGRFTLAYRRQLDRAGLRLRVEVTVYPDHFYTGFFESLLASGTGVETGQIREALEASRRSQFVIFKQDVPLT
jgi:nitrate/TMAO reductase-like tetraheme cytochrome c subunit